MSITRPRFLTILTLSRCNWRSGLAALACVAVIATAYVLRQASRVLDESAARVESASELPFTVTRLDANVSTAPAGLLSTEQPFVGSGGNLIASGFEPISSPAVFNDAQVFQGRLLVSGPSGLLAYDGNSELTARYRVGLELPAAPLVSMATGVAAGEDGPELLMATAGEGLLTFDGRAFRQVRAADPPYRRLTAVLGLETGRVLVGTEKKGVLVYDGERLAPLNPALADVHVTALAGNESSLWVGTLDRGVWHWHAGELERLGEADGMPDPHVLSIAVDGDSAYVGTPLGVAEFHDGRFARALAYGCIARTLLIRHEARGPELVIGTVDQGVVRVPLAPRASSSPAAGETVPGASAEGEGIASLQAGTPIERLFEKEGKLYALAEDGLYLLDDHDAVWQRVAGRPEGAEGASREGPLLTDRNVSAVAVDRAGRLWVGYFDHGLDIVDGVGGSIPQLARHVENDHVFCVNRIVPDPDRGVTAVATANGLVMFDVAGNARQVLGRPEGLIADHITDVLVRPEGMIVATPAGLTLIDSTGARSLYAFQGLVNNHVYALAASGRQLLAGTLGGLSVLDASGEAGTAASRGESGRLDDLTVRASYTTANSGLRHNWITAIVAVGERWFVGTYGAGILRFDGTDHWRTFPDASDTFVINPGAMLVTPSRVYAGTLDRGLYVYDRASERWSTLNKGLPSLNVQAIAAGGGYLYVGTDNGLVRIAERN